LKNQSAGKSKVSTGETASGTQDSSGDVGLEADEKLDWYRHREWKPENREDVSRFVPSKLESPTFTPPVSTAAKSVWNSADTWEEKDVTRIANEWLKSELLKLDDIESISDMEGYASITSVRGSTKYLFDFSFKLKTSGPMVTVRDFSTTSDLEISSAGEFFRKDLEKLCGNLVKYLSLV